MIPTYKALHLISWCLRKCWYVHWRFCFRHFWNTVKKGVCGQKRGGKSDWYPQTISDPTLQLHPCLLRHVLEAGGKNSTRVMWKQELLQPLWLSLGCFPELGRLSCLIWKRRLRATCWYENQDCNPTYIYFMIISWYSPGSTKEVIFTWLFFLSNELKIVISFIKQFKTHDITTYIKEIVIQFSLCLYEQQSYSK